jgi:hypothetical protein
MGGLAWITGFIGGLCMVMGIVTVTEVAPQIGEEFTWMFWFVLSAILLLMSIAFAVGRSNGGGGDYE